jgi:hypothetical protein
MLVDVKLREIVMVRLCKLFLCDYTENLCPRLLTKIP